MVFDVNSVLVYGSNCRERLLSLKSEARNLISTSYIQLAVGYGQSMQWHG